MSENQTFYEGEGAGLAGTIGAAGGAAGASGGGAGAAGSGDEAAAGGGGGGAGSWLFSQAANSIDARTRIRTLRIAFSFDCWISA
jgi:hypothetical protein